MFKHEKQLLREVRVERPNPLYAAMLQEQIGGPHGEMKAGLQYLAQSFRIADPKIRDVFLDIAAEELSHLEMVATLANLLNGEKPDASRAVAGGIVSHVTTGLAPTYANAAGFPWTSAYIEVVGDLPSDILSDIAAEQRAKVVYEHLHRQIADAGVREAIDFLLNREEAHSALFREALRQVQDTGSMRDFGVTPDSRLYFDLSTPGRYFREPATTPPRFQEQPGGGQPGG
ncbi:MAG: manganese catalase family protein [Acetobacteraceae bacterium]|nr:manganese catalase family protein [Acetobacteraceae bacterium]